MSGYVCDTSNNHCVGLSGSQDACLKGATGKSRGSGEWEMSGITKGRSQRELEEWRNPKKGGRNESERRNRNKATMETKGKMTN